MSFTSPLTVELGERSYPIFIGQDLWATPDLITPYLASRQVCVVTNETVAQLYQIPLIRWLSNSKPDLKITCVSLPDGEAYKTLQILNRIFDALLGDGHNRKTTLIAFGGGVVGDMTGFAAACYQRGVDFIQIPTTLLSQVDSSVGGKTGVNHLLGKNMIGAFYQPRAVFMDLNLLNTLPDRELSAGLAEIIKYGLIADAQFFKWLELNIEKLNQRDPDVLAYAIRRSCEIKAEVVAGDERESGRRAILNFGHTYGHAIETEMGYGTWLHGEAVAVGMMMACELSFALGWIDETLVTRTRQLLLNANLPIDPPVTMSGQAFLQHMAVDKKALENKIRLVLLTDCGNALLTEDYDQTVFMKQMKGLAN